MTEHRTPNLPRAGVCAGSCTLRRDVADFRVDEIIDMQPEGSGEHLWLQVRKTGENSDEVARMLARAARVPPSAVGYAGRKDRHAITTQWFSVQLPGRADPPHWELPPSVEVLQGVRRLRKLHTGGLRGNRFRIVVRDFRGDAAALEQRLQSMRARGAPNYFGEQRFGRDGGNVARALQWFAGASAPHDRRQRGLLLSAARSSLFNALLAERVLDGSWCAALPGDVLMLDGRGSFFAFDATDTTIAARIAVGDIHASGALWGRGRPATQGAVADLENRIAALHPALVAGLERNGLEQERRALRVMPRELEWDWLDATSIALAFTLAAGCYATTLIDEMLDTR